MHPPSIRHCLRKCTCPSAEVELWFLVITEGDQFANLDLTLDEYSSDYAKISILLKLTWKYYDLANSDLDLANPNLDLRSEPA